MTEQETYTDENIWGVVGDIFEEAMLYDIPMPVVLAGAIIWAGVYIVRRRFGK